MRPSAFPHAFVLLSCSEGKRLSITSRKLSTRVLSARSIQGTRGSSCVIHCTHSGSVHSSSVVGVPASASTSP